ncbi:MAG TPA: TetR/AcrR family transcriptional regulator [Deltaproteobacteria bacterium]|nr:TetR/AcrR family transcriptional regulator [Deltaproteobacteria bacterium]
MTRSLKNKSPKSARKTVITGQKKIKNNEVISATVASRIKNPELVRKKHLHIAKKASKLFIKKGYHQTTMREISKATGMAIGNLYGYISRKEDVLSLAFNAYHQYAQESLDKKEGVTSNNPEDLLRLFVRGALHNVRIFREEIILMYRESRTLPKNELQNAQKKEMTQIQILETIIQRGINEKLFRPQDSFFAASMVYHQLIFLTMRGWLFSRKYSTEETEALLEDYIINSIVLPKNSLP